MIIESRVRDCVYLSSLDAAGVSLPENYKRILMIIINNGERGLYFEHFLRVSLPNKKYYKRYQ